MIVRGGEIATLSLSSISSNNVLTPFWFFITTFFEVGIGVIAYAGLCYVVPFLRARATQFEVDDKRLRVRKLSGNKVPDALFPLSTYPNGKPKGRIYFLGYLFARGSVYVGMGGVLLYLAGAKALVSPLTWQGLQYDILFARASNTPDGAHVFSYLGIPMVGFAIVALYKDEFLGALTAAFIVALHEIPWTLMYYIQYGQYLNASLMIYVLKDISFLIMCSLFALAFFRYTKKIIPMQEFFVAGAIWYLALLAWYFIGFPITTINNYEYGTTIYHITKWWGSPFVNGIEVGSWVLVEVLVLATMFLYVRHHAIKH